MLNVAADSASAFGSSSRPTSSETNACRTGVSIALITPVTAASANTCHSRAQPPATRTPITSAATANPALTAMSNSRLSNRSASFPPYSVSSRIGANCSAVTQPSAPAESCDSCRTSQSWAVNCIHTPMSFTSCPVANSR